MLVQVPLSRMLAFLQSFPFIRDSMEIPSRLQLVLQVLVLEQSVKAFS